MTSFLSHFLGVLLPCLLQDKEINLSLFWRPYRYYDGTDLEKLAPFILSSVLRRLNACPIPSTQKIWPDDQTEEAHATLTADQLSLRANLLTLLLLCLSEGLFITFDNYPTQAPRWLTFLCQEAVEGKALFFKDLTKAIIGHQVKHVGIDCEE